MLSLPDVTNVIDVGAGKAWHFPSHYKSTFGIRLIGLDIDGQEMESNVDLDEKVVCDVTKDVPLPAEAHDLLMVSSGLERFSDNRRFLENASRLLRPGGYLLAQCPSPLAPFAIANRLLPAAVTRRLLNTAMADDASALGFKAYYDRTSYAEFKALSAEVGLIEGYHVPGYYSSSYAEFFLPLWLLSYLYDTARFGLGIKALASYNLFLLRRPGGANQRLQLYAWN